MLQIVRIRIIRLQLFLVSELFEFYKGEVRELFEFKGCAKLFDVRVLIEELGYIPISRC